jgi:hypothetical protein
VGTRPLKEPWDVYAISTSSEADSLYSRSRFTYIPQDSFTHLQRGRHRIGPVERQARRDPPIYGYVTARSDHEKVRAAVSSFAVRQILDVYKARGPIDNVSNPKSGEPNISVPLLYIELWYDV